MTKGTDRGRHDVFARVFRVCAYWPVCVSVGRTPPSCSTESPYGLDARERRGATVGAPTWCLAWQGRAMVRLCARV